MFTGIIQAVGKVVKYARLPHNGRASAEPCGGRLWIRTPFKKLQRGESIAVDGVCLTVAARKGSVLQFDLGPETLRVTTLEGLQTNTSVNLERALRVGDRLGGHWVTGHIEETGHILRVESEGPNRWFHIQIPRTVSPYVIRKGSLAVDGVSLTIASVGRGQVTLMIVPHTLSHTTLGLKKSGDKVNLEPDVLAKYVKGQKT